MSIRLMTALLISSFVALAACGDQGPLEQAGEELDEAAEDPQVEGETLGNQANDVADEMSDAAD